MESKVAAVLEVVLVFAVVMIGVWALGASPIAEWQTRVLHWGFLQYVLFFMALPLAVIASRGKKPADYGISLQRFRQHVAVAFTCWLPVVLSYLPGSFVRHDTWLGALVLSAANMALLVVLPRFLNRNPDSAAWQGVLFTIAGLGLVGLWRGTIPPLPKMVLGVSFFLFLVGLGEELLFRGYIQSRLNEAYGRPYEFFGINWGWGAIIASLLFGLMHLFASHFNPFLGQLRLTPWWAVWTFFAALVDALIREKTGSIIAPAILHGLPRALAYAVLGF
jgi:membrane protease YdiL (CAAX protease family)